MNYEMMILNLISQSQRYAMARPVILGGVPSESGGAGGPPGGFVGYLTQKRVAYDTLEIASSGVPASGASLYDNLNHIRYRIEVLESGGVGGGGHEILNSGISFPQRSKLDFTDNIIVVDDLINDKTIVKATNYVMVTENLTSQVDWITDTFTISKPAKMIFAYVNWRQLDGSNAITNPSGLSVTLGFVPTMYDTVHVTYQVDEELVLKDDTGVMLVDGNGSTLFVA